MHPKNRDHCVTHRLRDTAVVCAAIGYCAWQSRHLWTTAWKYSPFDRYAGLAFLIWCIPAIVALLQPKLQRSARLLGLAIACGAMSQVCEVRALAYLGLAFSLSAAQENPRLVWFLSSVSWMPALGWLASQTLPDQTVMIRVALASIGTVFGCMMLRLSQDIATQPATQKGSSQPSRLSLPANSLVPGVIVLVIVAILWERYPMVDALDCLQSIPRKGIGFEGVDVPLTEKERINLTDANVLKRVYRVNGQRFLMTVADGTFNRHAVHDPTYCFRGDGWRIEDSAHVQLSGGAARIVGLSKNGRYAEAVYWYSDGHSRHASIVRYWWQTTIRRLTRGAFLPEPVLVLLRPVGQETVEWKSLFNDLPMLNEI